jgi:hypothetical protein
MDKTRKSANSKRATGDRTTRRPYAAPKLIEYGSVAKLTQGNGTVKPGDGGPRNRL